MFNTNNKSKSLRLNIKSEKPSNLLFRASLLGLSIYLVSQFIGLILTIDEYGPILDGGNVSKLLLTESMFLFISLGIIIFLTRGKIDQYGLNQPIGEVKWGSVLGFGLFLGSIATIIIIVTGANGNPSLEGLGIRGKILLLWFLASISEEIFVRGLLQGYLTPLENMKITFGSRNISYPVILSTIFFGIIHLPLIFFGADFISVSVIFLMTLTLGYFTATLRENHHSILPSIGAHITTNIGGTMLGPIVFAILVGPI